MTEKQFKGVNYENNLLIIHALKGKPCRSDS
jgi:hypothetical protein